MADIIKQQSSGLRPRSERVIWGGLLALWLLVLCFVPDPRPLGAPEWAVGLVRTVLGLSEAGARVASTVALRGVGIGLVGLLAAQFFSSVRLVWAMPLVLVTAPLLAMLSQWINYGYFPVFFQMQLALVSAVLGGMAGLILRGSRLALLGLCGALIGWYLLVASTGISDDLDVAARATAVFVLEQATHIPDGDAGFEQLIKLTFGYAEDNSRANDALFPNQAALLALGVIVGEERVAKVAGRSIDPSRLTEIQALRNRITLRGRNDLARHFCVSAALAILADENRSLTVGIAKEMMDATEGGSGFSFADLAVDRAGILFASAATRDDASARSMQQLVRSGLTTADYCPSIEGLPEGLTRDEFHTRYGGLGGELTRQLLALIDSRLSTCKGLKPGP